MRPAGCFLPSPSEGNIAHYACSAEALILHPQWWAASCEPRAVVFHKTGHTPTRAGHRGLVWPLPAGRAHQLCLPADSRAHSLYHQDNFTSFTLMLKNSFCGFEFRAGTHTQTKGFPQEILKGIICTVMSSVLLKQWKRCTEVSLLWRVKTYSASCEKQMKNKIQHTSHTYRP